MKKTAEKKPKRLGDDMRSEYRFDYRSSRPNRFAGQIDKKTLVVLIDKDVSRVFPTAESVNAALRALITALPKSSRK